MAKITKLINQGSDTDKYRKSLKESREKGFTNVAKSSKETCLPWVQGRQVAGLRDLKSATPFRNTNSVVNLLMCQRLQCTPGKRVLGLLSQDMRCKTSGTWMKLAAFTAHFWIRAFLRNQRNAKEARSQKSG